MSEIVRTHAIGKDGKSTTLTLPKNLGIKSEEFFLLEVNKDGTILLTPAKVVAK